MINKNFKKVMVVLGGTSGERAVSLESGKACIKALKKMRSNSLSQLLAVDGEDYVGVVHLHNLINEGIL